MNAHDYIATDLISILCPSKNPISGFRAMTGCKMIMVDHEKYAVKCCLPLTTTGRKWNYMTISVNGKDLIDIVCEKFSTRGGKISNKEVFRMENMYRDQVLRIFREKTGVATYLNLSC